MPEEKYSLTKYQSYWLEHVRACTDAGKTIVDYSREQGFSAEAMYAGKRKLVRKGVLPRSQKTPFQRVEVAATVSSNAWCIQLPNGTSVSFTGDIDSEALDAILKSV